MRPIKPRRVSGRPSLELVPEALLSAILVFLQTEIHSHAAEAILSSKPDLTLAPHGAGAWESASAIVDKRIFTFAVPGSLSVPPLTDFALLHSRRVPVGTEQAFRSMKAKRSNHGSRSRINVRIYLESDKVMASGQAIRRGSCFLCLYCLRSVCPS
ncbi:hypothetical protein V6L77_07950 [Pannonibacter sp. Pt2-lr]